MGRVSATTLANSAALASKSALFCQILGDALVSPVLELSGKRPGSLAAVSATRVVEGAALYAIATLLTWPFAVAVFVIGWILQFVGHYFEGKSPAFLTNLVHLLIGPLWISLLIGRR